MATTNVEDTAGIGATAIYGRRPTELVRASNEWVGGQEYKLTLAVRGADISQNITIPAGAIIRRVTADVREVFVVTGTTPAMEVGTNGSEETNGFTVTESQLENLGITDLTSTLAGTWDAEADLAADTIVGIALSGTSPVLAVGEGLVVYAIEWTAGGAEAVA